MIPFRASDAAPVTREEMRKVRQIVETPYKIGPVVTMEDEWTDSPSVFFWQGRWYMYYISISRRCETSGYRTHLAVSDDLVHWEPLGDLPMSGSAGAGAWDSRQCAGYAAFADISWDGHGELLPAGGHYYLSYLGGCADGYEPDPLCMGLARGDSPLGPFVRFREPILRPDDPDARPGETKTLYRSFLFADADRTTGHPFVAVYNGKAQDDRERIFAAVSEDGEHWERYGDGPILDDTADCPDNLISGDPQIVRIGDLYVMFYFRLQGGHAFDTFAASRDLVHWTPWRGEPLLRPSEPWDSLHAHKPWIVCRDGVVYHFYCACSESGERCIALASSSSALFP